MKQVQQAWFVARTLALVATLSAASAAQTTWYVAAGATPPGNGSQGQPYASIQYAISRSTTLSGDTVLVAPGTYVENVIFQGKQLVVRSSSGPVATIIDGNQIDSCVRIVNNEGSATALDGFTLRNGSAGIGGGLRVYTSSPRIRNCVIVDNTAIQEGGGAWLGFGNMTLEHCILARNSAPSGGGLRLDYGFQTSLSRCTITGNTAASGAGMDIRFGSSGPIFDSIVWGNIGPAVSTYAASPAFRYCDVEGGFAGTANIDADPHFVNAAASNWSLAPASPCIDAGDPTSPFDADGTRADMGALPFANTACASTSYCTAGVTANGCTATIASSGTPSATSGAGFTLNVTGVEGQKQGIVFYGISGRTALPWATGSSSVLCVKPPTQRTLVQNAGGTLNACNGSLAIDWNAFIAAHPAALGQPFAAGQVVDAQAWFRDPPSPKTTSLSDAIEFALCP